MKTGFALEIIVLGHAAFVEVEDSVESHTILLYELFQCLKVFSNGVCIDSSEASSFMAERVCDMKLLRVTAAKSPKILAGNVIGL